MVKHLLTGLLVVVLAGLFGQPFKINTSLDFGDVPAGSMVSLSAWVVNQSDTPLIINNIPNSGGNLICSFFSKEAARKGDSLKVAFSFHPDEGYIGIKKKGFTLKTNVGDENIYVTARVIRESKSRGASPTFNIVPGKRLDFGEVEIGDTPKITLLLINTSDAPLIINYVGWGEPCFVPEWSYEPVLRKGDTAKIFYKLLSYNRQPEKLSKTSAIRSNAAQPDSYIEIRLEATLVEKKKAR